MCMERAALAVLGCINLKSTKQRRRYAYETHSCLSIHFALIALNTAARRKVYSAHAMQHLQQAYLTRTCSCSSAGFLALSRAQQEDSGLHCPIDYTINKGWMSCSSVLQGNLFMFLVTFTTHHRLGTVCPGPALDALQTRQALR
eukprot:1161516-Pelagomonas_calceolata.AAC.5